jgi:hypothetical protein
MRKYIREAQRRHSDQKYYLTKLLGFIYLQENPNPEFTDEDEKMKLVIFDIPNTKTCFITNNDSNGVGDHIYEINGYFKKTNKHGINDKWNLVPVEGKINSSYKKFEFKINGKKIKKDIGYEELTIYELDSLISSSNVDYNEMALIYCKMQEWKMYVRDRGAKLCYEETQEFTKIRDNFKNNYDKLWKNTINEITKLKNQ